MVKAVGEAGIPEDGAEAAVTDNTNDCVFYWFFFQLPLDGLNTTSSAEGYVLIFTHEIFAQKI